MAETSAFQRLRAFLLEQMSMTGIYQPVMLRTILEGGGLATRRQIAREILRYDLGQIEHYERVVSRWPTQILKKHKLITHDRGTYELSADLKGLQEWERLSLIALCDQKFAEPTDVPAERLRRDGC